MSKSTEFSVGVLDDSLPTPFFNDLVRAVREVGTERLANNGSYTTTFWFPRGDQPRNIAEEAIVQLSQEVEPGPECIGVEWWLGRLPYGSDLQMHFDRDLALRQKTGESVHPMIASVLYLNQYPSAPTVVFDQVLAEDGRTRIPAKAEHAKSVEAVSNRYMIFSGNLLHGVVHDPKAPKPEMVERNAEFALDLRLTLLVNYWHRRPLEPICVDYDGNIYPALRDALCCGSSGNCVGKT